MHSCWNTFYSMLVFGENLFLHLKFSLEKGFGKIKWKRKQKKGEASAAAAGGPASPPLGLCPLTPRAAQFSNRPSRPAQRPLLPFLSGSRAPSLSLSGARAPPVSAASPSPSLFVTEQDSREKNRTQSQEATISCRFARIKPL